MNPAKVKGPLDVVFKYGGNNSVFVYCDASALDTIIQNSDAVHDKMYNKHISAVLISIFGALNDDWGII